MSEGGMIGRICLGIGYQKDKATEGLANLGIRWHCKKIEVLLGTLANLANRGLWWDCKKIVVGLGTLANLANRGLCCLCKKFEIKRSVLASNRGEKKLDLVRHSTLSLVLCIESVPLHLLFARYHF